MKRLKKCAIVVAFSVLLALTMGIFTALAVEYESDVKGVVNATDVRLRAKSSTSSAILATMKKGTELKIVGHAEGWYNVIMGDKAGYVFDQYITIIDKASEYVTPSSAPAPASALAPEPEQETKSGVVSATNVRLRAADNTSSAILATMKKGTALAVLDSSNDWYKVALGDKTGYVLGVYVALDGAIAPRADGEVELVDWWSEAKGIMKSGTLATITDVASGISFQIKVHSSGNHADVEPLTAADTEKIKKIRGGKFSWTPRAILVAVNGRTIAASCNGMPHSVSNIKDNGFSGHFCIHFLNSRNHYNNSVDPDHQKQVMIAYNS